MILSPPKSTRTDPPFPYTTPCRSQENPVERARYSAFQRRPRTLKRRRISERVRVGRVPSIVRYRTIGGRASARRRLRARPLRTNRLSRSEEHTSELQSLMRTSYAVFCLQKKNNEINMIQAQA